MYAYDYTYVVNVMYFAFYQVSCPYSKSLESYVCVVGGYSSWGGGDPNNHGGREYCGSWLSDLRWNDGDCRERLYYICDLGNLLTASKYAKPIYTVICGFFVCFVMSHQYCVLRIVRVLLLVYNSFNVNLVMLRYYPRAAEKSKFCKMLISLL